MVTAFIRKIDFYFRRDLILFSQGFAIIFAGLCPAPHQRNFLEKVSLDSSKTLKITKIAFPFGEGAEHLRGGRGGLQKDLMTSSVGFADTFSKGEG